MAIQQIIEVVRVKYGMDLSVYSAPFLRKTLAQRVKETSATGLEDYLKFLSSDSGEMAILNDILHIGYTLFFRNSIDTSLIEEFILPDLIQTREKNKSRSVRIWSVGCAEGPEAYSLAMLTDKVIHDRDFTIPVMVFGTDISPASIEKAKMATYERSALLNVKLSFLDRYFIRNNSHFSVVEAIRNQVDFSPGNIIDPGYSSPPAAIFADFDLVSCCNLMIYYHHDIQKMILEKLYRSLSRNGYLLVGETERLIVEKSGKFRLVYPMGNIFIKN